MNSKIDNPQEIAPVAQKGQIAAGRPLAMWKVWLIMLGCEIAGYIILAAFQSEETPRLRNVLFIGATWMHPAGHVIEQGIDLFSGNTITASWQSWETVALLSLLMGFLIAPTLLLLSFRRLILNRLQQSSFPEKRVVAGFIIGGILCLPMFGMSPYVAYMQVNVSQGMHRDNSVYVNKDVIAADLTQIGLQARVFYYVPTAFGGGGHRWKNIPVQGGTFRDITLDDLKIASPVTGKVYGNLFPQSPNKFILEPITKDTILTITSAEYPDIKATITPHACTIQQK